MLQESGAKWRNEALVLVPNAGFRTVLRAFVDRLRQSLRPDHAVHYRHFPDVLALGPRPTPTRSSWSGDGLMKWL
jgi:hypothetical protein